MANIINKIGSGINTVNPFRKGNKRALVTFVLGTGVGLAAVPTYQFFRDYNIDLWKVTPREFQEAYTEAPASPKTMPAAEAAEALAVQPKGQAPTFNKVINNNSVVFKDDNPQGLRAFVNYDGQNLPLERTGISSREAQFELAYDVLHRDGNFEVYATDNDARSELVTLRREKGRVFRPS